MRLNFKDDVEAVLEILTEEKLQGMKPEKRLSSYISRAQLLELLGRGPEMLDAAQRAYALERNASTANLLVLSFHIGSMKRLLPSNKGS